MASGALTARGGANPPPNTAKVPERQREMTIPEID
jgi:hypothetical protein